MRGGFLGGRYLKVVWSMYFWSFISHKKLIILSESVGIWLWFISL